MKKYWFILGMLAFLSAVLIGCGGGGDSVTVTTPSGTTPPPTTETFHQTDFSVDPNSNTVILEVTLATVGNNVVHLVRNGIETTLPVVDIAKVFWNGENATWHSAPGGTGIGATFTPPTTLISHLFDSDNDGLVSVVAKNGDEYFINIDFIRSVNFGVDVFVSPSSGLISYHRL